MTHNQLIFASGKKVKSISVREKFQTTVLFILQRLCMKLLSFSCCDGEHKELIINDSIFKILMK